MVLIVGTLSCHTYRSSSLLAHPVPGAYLTVGVIFNGHSQQPSTNSHSWEERPTMTSPITNRLSIAVAPSIWIYEVQPPWECAASLAVVQVHHRGTPGGPPSPLPPHRLTMGLQSHKSNALQVDANSPAHSVSTVAATMCMNKHTQQITYLSRPIRTSDTQSMSLPHPIGTLWQPNIVHFQVRIDTSNELRSSLNTFVFCWYPESAWKVHPPVALWICRFLATK